MSQLLHFSHSLTAPVHSSIVFGLYMPATVMIAMATMLSPDSDIGQGTNITWSYSPLDQVLVS